MSGGSHIVAVGPGNDRPDAPNDTATAAQDDVLALDETWEEPAETRPRSRFGWVIPTFAILTVTAWTALFVVAQRDVLLAGGTLQQWTGWITSWAIPVLLVVAVWLLAMRTSSREAQRFGDAAKMLAEESLRLENRLTTVNRELSLAREFIAAQSRDLESLGRVAAERLSQNADRIAALILENGKQIDSIASVSTTALENMDKLRGDLPVIANSARDVTSQIGNAGRIAHSQLEELIGGFHRLNTFGEASERQVQSLRVKVDAALMAFEAQAAKLDEIASGRFGALEERSAEFTADLDSREVEALAAIRRRAEQLREELAGSWDDYGAKEQAALATLTDRLEALRKESDAFDIALREGEDDAVQKWQEAVEGMRKRLTEVLMEIGEIDAKTLDQTRKRMSALTKEAREVDQAMQMRVDRFVASLEERRAEHRTFESEGVTSLETQLAALDAAIAERQAGHLAHVEALAKRGEELSVRLGELGSQIEALGMQGSQANHELAQSIEALAEKIAANRERLAETDKAVSTLTDASVRLLELIQASSQHSHSQIPQALEAAQASLSDFEERTRAAALMLDEANLKGKELSDYVLAAQDGSEAALEKIDAHGERIAELRASLAALSQESEAISERAEEDLAAAIRQLQGALSGTIAQLDRDSSDAIEKIALDVGSRSAEAFDQALRSKTTEAIGELEAAAAHASGVSREAARQLRDQLSKVNELAGNLESRVQRARERAEEEVDNDFARRVALITESLNSNAIDIAKALSNDVTDTAWASYLRGDRGIFTRRAVRLLDNSQAREIAEIYDRDQEFREHVSRYIHDFEAMLRTMLSTRDGNALGVTLLSSDMGKLYVALAQAIERLRA
jgi:hypothetical protein